MKIFEVAANSIGPKLLGLAEFLLGRATDTDAKKEISVDSFVKLANDMNISITPDMLIDMSARPPLDGVMEPIDPVSNIIQFKGSVDQPVDMPVNKAQDIVAAAAKTAAKKDRSI